MLGKLAVRNVKRSIKDYFIYMITVTVAFSVIFAFNSIAFSPDIIELSSTMENFKYGVIAASVVIVFVVGWLINYTMKFMYMKRSKEFGTYMILGIEKKDISKIFLLENIILGVLASFISFFIGLIFSSVLSLIVTKLFEMPYKVSFTIHLIPILLSIFYFILIYIFSLIRSRRRIKKMKIYDLLYFDKINEKKIWKKGKTRNIFFIISVILGIVGLIFVDLSFNEESFAGGSPLFLFIAFIPLIISIYGVTTTFGDFILSIVLKNKKLKYKNDNLFIVRNISSKIKTMGLTLGTLSLLTMLTLISLNVSMIMKDSLENNVNQVIPYDVIIESIYSNNDIDGSIEYNEEEKCNSYRNYIDKNFQIKDDIIYNIYTMNNTKIRDVIDDYGTIGRIEYDSYLKLSDYNKLLSMLGRKEITLNDGEYFIHGNKDTDKGLKKILDDDIKININNEELRPKNVSNEKFVTGWGMGNAFFIIVPDKYVSDMKILDRLNAIITEKKTTEEAAEEVYSEAGRISQIVYNEDDHSKFSVYEYDNVKVRGEYLAYNRSSITIISFSLVYIALIFVAVIGTILSIQTLSDSTKYKYRFNLLKKLGVSESTIHKTIRKQTFINFVFPIIYPIIIATITTFSVNRIFNVVTSQKYTHIYSLIFSIFIFLIIYLIYYIATYFGFKKNIKE